MLDTSKNRSRRREERRVEMAMRSEKSGEYGERGFAWIAFRYIPDF